VWLRKSKVPGSAPGGLVWESLEDVVEVPDEYGMELLAIRDAGFSEAPAPTRAEPGPADDDLAEVAEAPTAPRRGRPRRTPTETAE
jgi:hypothetical protein